MPLGMKAELAKQEALGACTQTVNNWVIEPMLSHVANGTDEPEWPAQGSWPRDGWREP